MSTPTFPNSEGMISRDEAVNLILASIAMEEAGLSHIFNAQGESLQYIIGTLQGSLPPELATIPEVIQTNQSVQQLLQTASYNQLVLKQKLTNVLGAPTIKGAMGAVGPTGGLFATIYDAAEAPTFVAGQLIVGPDGNLYTADVDSPLGVPGNGIGQYTLASIAALTDFRDLPAAFPAEYTRFGNVGPQGPQGRQGIQGPVGPTGPMGAEGPQGAQGSIGQIVGQYSTFEDLLDDATLVPQDSDYYYITETGELYNWGSATEDWMNLGVIQGQGGPQGEVGVTGATGAKGETGATGETGPMGAPGEVGNVGRIVGQYATYTDLTSSHPTGPIDGQYYFVYETSLLYRWNPTEEVWVEIGDITGTPGVPGPNGVRGATGPTGAIGTSVSITVASQGTGVYSLNIQDATHTITTPNLFLTRQPVVYSQNMSSSGSRMDIFFGNMKYSLLNDGGYFRQRIAGATMSITADVFRITIYEGGTSEAQGMTNSGQSYGTNGVEIDNWIYKNSSESAVVRVRQQDPVTGHWSLHDIVPFISGDGARTDVSIYERETDIIY